MKKSALIILLGSLTFFGCKKLEDKTIKLRPDCMEYEHFILFEDVRDSVLKFKDQFGVHYMAVEDTNSCVCIIKYEKDVLQLGSVEQMLDTFNLVYDLTDTSQFPIIESAPDTTVLDSASATEPELGLQEGDKIIAVNGDTLSEPIIIDSTVYDTLEPNEF